MASYTSNEVYLKEESIVIAIDIGTTMTGVSFSHMYPGEKPSVRLVNQWPGQPVAGGDSKVPTLVAYQNGVACAHGATALDMVRDDDYQVARWFKLHLHPSSLKNQIHLNTDQGSSSDTSFSDEEIPPLPEGVSLKDIYTSFMAYVYKTTEDFFTNRTPNGRRIWDRLKDRNIIILCTPNGWGTNEQDFMRDAAIAAGILSAHEVDDRLEFVTEGEASVHYALAYTKSDTWVKKDVMFAVVDAGGSTVDSTLYICKSNLPRITLKRVCDSECVQAGGIFVNRAFRQNLCKRLTGSKFNEDELIDVMVDEFEAKTKRLFDGTQESSIIQFGRNKDNDPDFGITKGRITVDRETIRKSFDVTIERMISSVKRLIGNRDVHHLLLVGGFGDSMFLRNSLKQHLASSRVEIIVVDEPSKKAAVEGALIWSIKQLVTARVPQYTVGVRMEKIFDPNNPVHKERANLAKIGPSGAKMLDGVFEPLIEKDTTVATDFQKTFSFTRLYDDVPDTLAEFQESIFIWEGEGQAHWTDGDRGNLLPNIRRLCTLEANMSRLVPLLKLEKGEGGQSYCTISYEIVVEVGRTQLQARIQWRENQRMCLGPTRVLPSLLVSVERMEGVSAHAVHGIVGGGIGAETGIGGARRGADTGSGAPGRGLETGLGAAGGSAGAGVGDVGKGGQLEKDRRKEASRQAMEARKKREEELARQAEEAIKKKLEEKRQSEKEKKREFERQAQEARRREEELARQAEEAKHLGVAGRGAGTEVGDVGRGGQLEKDKRKEASRQAMEARKKREEELARQAEVARQRKLEEERQWLQSEITRLDQENQSIAQDVQDFEVKNESIKALNRDLGHQWSKLSADLDAQQKVLNQLPPSVSIDPPADTLIQLFNSLNASIADYAFEVLRGLNDKAESRALDKDDFASLRNLFKIRSDDPTNDFTVEPNIRPFLDKLEKMKEDLTPMDIIDPIIQFALCHHLYFKIFMPFTPSLTAGDSNALHDIYTKFRRGEPQERAARWRSITYKQLLSMQKPGALLQFIEDETNVFVELVYHILNALNKGEEAKPPTDLFKAAGDIFLAAMKVQERVKTEYISFDYEVTFYRRDIPKAMEIVDGAEKVALKLMRPIFDPGLMEASQGAIGTTAQSVWMTVGLGMIALKGVRNDGGIVKGEMRAPVKAKVICDNWDPNT